MGKSPICIIFKTYIYIYCKKGFIFRRLIFALCFSCVTEEATSHICNHSAEQRRFHTTVTSVELMFALERGYTLIKICSVYHFSEKRNDVFKDYLLSLSSFKLQASGFPENVKTDAEKKDFVAQLMEEYNLPNLDWKKFELNPGLRWVAKILLNSFWVTHMHTCMHNNASLLPCLLACFRADGECVKISHPSNWYTATRNLWLTSNPP